MTVALVLSGGGIRGISHLGVLKALDEGGIKISHISGTSTGAILGALYSSGLDPEFILDEIISTKFYTYMRPAFTTSGVLKMDRIGDFLRKYITNDSFEALNIPLTVAATNLQLGVTEYFNSGELINPILCSSCIPAVFKPVSYNGKTYIDGGVLNNFPLEPVKSENLIIGSDCNYIDDNFGGKGFKLIIERALLLAINGSLQEAKSKCHILIDPSRIKGTGVFEFRRAKEIFIMGYEEAKKQLTLYKNNLNG